MPEVNARVPELEYATNLPGANAYDEARRATADLCRLARLWVAIAESNEEALNPTHQVEYDDEDGEELPVPRSAIHLDPNNRREDFEKAVREHWQLWVQGVDRAKVAIGAVEDPELGPQRVAARLALMELIRIFFPPLFLLSHEQPGDHLMRPAGPMACRAGKQCNLRRHRIEEILPPLADFSDLMITYDPAAGMSSGETFDTDSGWTVKQLCDHLCRSDSLLKDWRDAAEPKVPGRKKKGESFTFGEIGRLSLAAAKLGHMNESIKLGQIAVNRKPPESPDGLLKGHSAQ
ncbi:MAG: hypothetical protein D6692_12935 [Planctomycetota bacterium]|nr:MAG: hypothetical protein D6692_12935 [Planctomycetota bacterium]